MSENLAQKKCVPCEDEDFPALTPPQAKDFMEHVPLWSLNEDSTELFRVFRFKDFKEALAYTNEIGEVAEEEGHHPDISLGWGKVEVRLTTHSIHGLSENDFIVAAKIDLLEN
ncbi:MAG: 4a-hydroxytetrahydrobiopterin dehydratase [Patescibacteria group bacterium]